MPVMARAVQRALRGVLILAAALLLLCGCEPPAEPAGREDREAGAGALRLTYYGQSSFLVEAGVRILIDPYSPELGYGVIDLPADLVTMSHHHLDHNYGAGGRGARILPGLTPEGDWNPLQEALGAVQIHTVNSFHDRRRGDWLGKNSIFVFQTASLRLVHLGDLGHPLDEEAVAQIGRADLLFIPVGGHYTLPYEEALEVIARLSPAIVIPMHYRTASHGDRNLATLEEFLDRGPPYPVRAKQSHITIRREELPAETEIWAMEYELP